MPDKVILCPWVLCCSYGVADDAMASLAQGPCAVRLESGSSKSQMTFLESARESEPVEYGARVENQ